MCFICSSEDDDQCSAIILHIHPVPEDKSKLLHGFKKLVQESPFMSFQVNQEVMFGRGEEVPIFFNDPTASREHMTLTGLLTPSSPHNCQGLQFMIKSLKALKVNNVDINKGEERMLKSGDVLKIGQIAFTVEINPHNVCNNAKYVLEVRILEAAAHNQSQSSGLPFNNGISQAVQQGVIHSQQFISLPQQNGVLMQQQLLPMQGLQSAPLPQPGAFPQPISGQQFMPVHQQGIAAQQMYPGMAYLPAGMPLQQQLPMQFPQMQQQNPYGMPSQQQMPLQFSQLQQQNPLAHMNTNQFHGYHLQGAQQRRDLFTGQMPSENEEGRPHNISIEETHLPNLSKETSFEETQPPKQ